MYFRIETSFVKYIFPDVIVYGLVWNLWEPLYSETLETVISWETPAREYIPGSDLYTPPPAFLSYLFQPSLPRPFRVLSPCISLQEYITKRGCELIKWITYYLLWFFLNPICKSYKIFFFFIKPTHLICNYFP